MLNDTTENQLSFSEASQITVRDRDKMFAVEIRDWKRIKRMINNLSEGQNWWSNLAWFMSAATLSVFIAWITVSESNNNKDYFLFAFFFLLIITIILFLVEHNFSN